MHECGEAEGIQQDDTEAQAVELSIVILVDGEEKCCSNSGRGVQADTTSNSSSRTVDNSTGPQSCSSVSTMKSNVSSVSLPCCNKKIATVDQTQSTNLQQEDTCRSSRSASCCSCNRKVVIPICLDSKSRCPHHSNRQDAEDSCGNFTSSPRIIPTPQSTCPCAALRNIPCGSGEVPLTQVRSQTAACQTISHGECQTDPCFAQRSQTASCQTSTNPCLPTGQMSAPPARNQTACCQTTSVTVPPTAQMAGSKVMIQSASCQTGQTPTVATKAPTRPCTPKPKKCCHKKKAKSAICQTQAQPRPCHKPRKICAQALQQPMVTQSQTQTGTAQAPTTCPSVPVISTSRTTTSAAGEKQTIIIQTPEGTVVAVEQTPPMEEPSVVDEGSEKIVKTKTTKVRRARRPSKEEKLKEPLEARKARKSSLPPDQLNFSQFPTVQLTFVDYFLKSEGGVSSVLALSETKMEYEKKCKSVLASMPNHKRNQAEEFFNKIIEAIQVKVPESNNTEIKHYHLTKYLQPIVSALQIQAEQEVHTISKYHNYILSVVNFMEERLRERQAINPDALVDVETHLLAGILSRFYPIFIKIKDTIVNMQMGSPEVVPSEEFVKQLRKLILAIYVEIVCIDVTFNNTLTSLSYLPSVEVQEKYRHQLGIRKKHARHAVTWAARCITTALLYYHIGTGM